ncbi:MAG TPA: hypothetical protein VL863_08015 [bacterium]|nr:hypothetical protein [bacterium]
MPGLLAVLVIDGQLIFKSWRVADAGLRLAAADQTRPETQGDVILIKQWLAIAGTGVDWRWMNDDFTTFITYIWQHQPIIVVLLIGGLIMFTLLVIDTHRHRKKSKKTRHRIKHNNRHH